MGIGKINYGKKGYKTRSKKEYPTKYSTKRRGNQSNTIR
jgi:hypothetical protein